MKCEEDIMMGRRNNSQNADIELACSITLNDLKPDSSISFDNLE